MSYTFTLTGTSSVLIAGIFSLINLSDVGVAGYSVGLLSFQSYNSIPNVTENVNTKFYYGNEVISLPTGTYEVDAIANYVRSHVIVIGSQGG